MPRDFPFPCVVVITGVSGSGKTTVGRALAHRLQWRFHDADDLHTPENRDRMQRGVPLDDDRREPWLLKVREVIEDALRECGGAVVACSALKERYRTVLTGGLQGVRFIFLDADRDLLLRRLAERKDHFAGPSLLDSQLDALEPPRDALKVDASQPVETVVDAIVAKI